MSCFQNIVNTIAIFLFLFLNRNEAYYVMGCDSVKYVRFLYISEDLTGSSFHDRRVSEASRNTASIFRARVNHGRNQQMQAAS
jgi:hypothetical protein